MKLSKSVAFAAASLLAAVSFSAEAAQAPGAGAAPPPVLAWTPKPTRLTPYAAPMKPRTRLSEVKAAHRGQARWVHDVVRENRMYAFWTQMAPGDKTKKQMLADTRTAMIVWEGQVRVTVDGQAPFVATKGFMIQVPYRNFYQIENVGAEPALLFESRPEGSVTFYAEDETPPAAPAGQAWYKARLQGRDTYERQQRPNQPQLSVPYYDFFKAVQTTPPRGPFMVDDRNYMNIIRGPGIPRQPDHIKGHFHVNYGEYWFIMEGAISYLIEGMDYFVTEPGDVVYVPAGRWHRAQFAAPNGGMSTRISMNGFFGGAHQFDPNEAD